MRKSRFEPGRAVAPIPHWSLNCPLKKRPRRQFIPFKIFGEKIRRKHHEIKFTEVTRNSTTPEGWVISTLHWKSE